MSSALGLGLAAALLLAAGCVLYIFRIERQNSRRYQEVLKARAALEQFSAKLVDAQETERRTISRELHDQVGQTLNAVLVEAANLANGFPRTMRLAFDTLDNIRKFADSSVNSIRDIALLLRPSMLDDLGLIPALEWQAREVSRRSGIKVTVHGGKCTGFASRRNAHLYLSRRAGGAPQCFASLRGEERRGHCAPGRRFTVSERRGRWPRVSIRKRRAASACWGWKSESGSSEATSRSGPRREKAPSSA